jgi:hypothetical protein
MTEMSLEAEVMRLREGLHDVRNELQKGALAHVELKGAVQQLEQAVGEGHKEILAKLNEVPTKYVPVARFSPVERVVYGIVACVLLAVLGKVVTSALAPDPLPAYSIQGAPQLAPRLP